MTVLVTVMTAPSVLGKKPMASELLLRNPLITQLSTTSPAPELNLIPTNPVPSPSMSRPFRYTTSVAPAAMTMPFVPDTSTPAVPASQEMVIDFVMVTPPKPPGSRQLISPPAAVLEMAPAKVLHGAVRLHGSASLPTPETQVRVACAGAGAAYIA